MPATSLNEHKPPYVCPRGDRSTHGLGIAQFLVLSLLAETPGLANADLARRAFVTPQSMNEVLKRLESTGLVERRKPHERPHPQRVPNPHWHREVECRE